MTSPVRVLVMRHASFYAPLIATVAAGLLDQEGVGGQYAVKPPNRNPFEMLAAGEVDVMQSAPSSSWARLERGTSGLPVHFAQINARDGFWILSRTPGPFRWTDLEGRTVLADHGPQPLAMLRYAAWREGVDLDRVKWEDAGGPEGIVARWRSCDGDYAHLQGPVPQQLALEGLGFVVRAVGEAMPPLAFSTIASMPSWLETDRAHAFMRAYRKSLDWIHASPAADIARPLEPFFDEIDPEALAASIDAYQKLGSWRSDPRILPAEYGHALDVFEWNGLIRERHAYDLVVSNPWPGAG